MSALSLDGSTVGYAVDGEGEPFVLLHGTTQDRTAWDLVRAATPGQYRWIMPELPGSGESSLPSGPLAVEELADQVVAVADHVGAERFHLAGYSLGAVVALAVAARHPGRTRSVTSLCGWARTDGRMRVTFDLWRRLIATDPTLFAHYAFADGMTRLGIESVEPMFDELVAMVAGMLAPGSDAQLELDRRVDITDLLRSIECPTLILGAVEDRWVDVSHSRELAASITGARLVELPAGHLAVQELARDLGPLLHAHATEVA